MDTQSFLKYTCFAQGVNNNNNNNSNNNKKVKTENKAGRKCLSATEKKMGP